MEDNNNPANRSCGLMTTRPARSTLPSMNYNSNNSNSNKRYLSSLKQQFKHLVTGSMFGVVIILSCLSPSIIASSLSNSAAMAPANSAFDFTINNPIGESSGESLRSLPYVSSASSSFDPSSYKNIYEAIRNHPDLREFANLCELDGVKEIVSMDRTPLTVFAPIDRSLQDLLAKSKSHSINLIELAKHHIAQGIVTPDENSKYPVQFNDYALLSPLYLNQQQQPASAGARKGQVTFVNNAKILATYLIQIDSDNFQVLHLIDQVIEFAYLSRRTQLPSGGGPLSASGQQRRLAIKKSKFSLDDLYGDQQAAYEFHERFGDLQAGQPQVDLFHARAYRGAKEERLLLERDEFNLDQLGRIIRQQPKLRGKLFQVNESSTYNTYFLPMNNDELAGLLKNTGKQLSLLEALVIPDQVLFTRLMPFGVGHSTLFDRLHSAGPQRVSLSLAKSLPIEQESSTNEELDDAQASRRLLSTPLLLQAKCQTVGAATPSSASESCQPGVTSAELLVANIPLSHGVLHLIRRPLPSADQTSVLDYLNDNDNQLSNLVSALGSRTSALTERGEPPIRVNRFRELLARERQMLSTLSAGSEPSAANKTLLVPSDRAFASLRYDLRALVQGDESLIPKEWSQSYRQDLLERLIKSHVVPHESITTDQLDLTAGAGQLQALSDNGRSLVFTRSQSAAGSGSETDYFVECDSTRARLIQHDLSGSNGVVHIIDRVLGEEQETVHSLLKSIVLRYNHSLEADSQAGTDLNQLVQSSIRNNKQRISENSLQSAGELAPATSPRAPGAPGSLEPASSEPASPELQAISKSIGQYLDELTAGNRRQLQLLASSVNISYQLARLTSLAEGLDDWNEKFRHTERMFTYFVPSDLAWIRLQQAQPELYKPLMYFLEHQQDEASSEAPAQGGADEHSVGRPAAPTKSSESSHRLRQILERHLVIDRKIDARNLNQLDSVKTMGATLRLVESPAQSQLTATYSGDAASLSGQPSAGQSSNFAALHSIFTGTSSSSSGSSLSTYSIQQQPKLKSLKLDSASANIVQASEASNGFVYVIDSVLLLPEDSNYIVQTSQPPAVSSSMSSLLGAHHSAIFDFVHSLLAPAPLNMSTNSILTLMATLAVAILILLMLALVLVVRKSRQSKQNRHQQLESGLTSSSSANSGSTSTTKSL